MNPVFLNIPRASDSSDEASSSDDIDSDIEITSTLDEEENEVVRMGGCLRLVSDDSDEDVPVLNHMTLSPSARVQLSGNDETGDADPDSTSTGVSVRDESFWR